MWGILMNRRARARRPYPTHLVVGGVLVVINGLALTGMFGALAAHSSHSRALDARTAASCVAAVASAVGLPPNVEARYRLGNVRFAGPNQIRASFTWTGSPRALGGAPQSGVAHCVYSTGGRDVDQPLFVESAWVER